MKKTVMTRKENIKYKSRLYNKKHASRRDEFATSRETSAGKLVSLFRRHRELRQDPNTNHPLSVEEFDSIPDITEDYKKEK